MKKIIAVLMVGLIGGGVGGWFAHERLAPQLGLEGEEIEALVIEERREEERLVLTLESGERTLLVSFVERREDVASLVSEGDTILVRVPRSGPFADDPAIVEVRRAEGHVDEPVDEEGADTDGEAVDGEAAEEDGEEEAEEPETEPAAEDGVSQAEAAPSASASS